MNRLLILCGLLASSLLSSPAALGSPQKPDEKRSFTADDLKERGRGKWIASAMPDQHQSYDESAPVKIVKLTSFWGTGKYAGLLKVIEATVSNRGAKDVESMQLSWAIVDAKAREIVFLRGSTAVFPARVAAGEEAMIDTPRISFTEIAKPLRKDGELNGDFMIFVAVEEVQFADGSSWRRAELAAF